MACALSRRLEKRLRHQGLKVNKEELSDLVALGEYAKDKGATYHVATSLIILLAELPQSIGQTHLRLERRCS